MTSGAAGHGNAAVHNSYVSLLGGTFRTRQINPPTPMLCYCDFMLARRLLLLLCLLAPLLLAQQPKSGIPEPSLPVIDDNACPFEGCSFGKWIVIRDFKLFSSWKEDRKPLTAVRKGQVVDALTGVHITYEPDRIQVFRPIADLHLNPGDVILRYMYRGEGFADIWTNRQFHKEYDCSFITEKNNSGCSRDCNAKVVSEGRKEWWARVKTAPGVDGWAKVDGQFDCMDALGRSLKCENLAAPPKTRQPPPSKQQPRPSPDGRSIQREVHGRRHHDRGEPLVTTATVAPRWNGSSLNRENF